MLIDRAPGTFAGLTFLDSNLNGVKDKSELNFYQRRNIGTARVLGGAFEREWRFSDGGSL